MLPRVPLRAAWRQVRRTRYLPSYLPFAAQTPPIRPFHSLRRAVPSNDATSRPSVLTVAVAVSTALLSSTFLVSHQAEEVSDDLQLPPTLPHPSPPPTPRPFTSSPLYPHPTRPNISIATAESLPDLLSLRLQSPPSHLLVEVYSPYCHACERLSPILDQVGYILSSLTKSTSLSPSSAFLVSVLDDGANHLPGFLTAEEERYLPVLKFFPAPAPGAPLPSPHTYDGPHNASAVLRWMVSVLPPEERPPQSTVEGLVRATAEESYERVREVFRRQREEEVKRDETLLLFDHAPCGEEMKAMMETMILSRYRGDGGRTKSGDAGEREEGAEDLDGEAGQVMKRFEQCVRGKKKETEKYWKSVKDIAEAQIHLSEDADDPHSVDMEGGEEESGAHNHQEKGTQ